MLFARQYHLYPSGLVTATDGAPRCTPWDSNVLYKLLLTRSMPKWYCLEILENSLTVLSLAPLNFFLHFKSAIPAFFPGKGVVLLGKIGVFIGQ